MSFTSDEVNYLIYRYLQESGFQHTAFTLSHEGLVHKGNIKGSDVPPGALVTLLQKALLYVGVEWHVRDDGIEIECNDTPGLLSSLAPHRCEGRPVRREASDKENAKDNKRDRRDVRKRPRPDLEEESVDMSEPPPEVPEADVVSLDGHQAPVYACAWNPTRPRLLATTAADSTARLWQFAGDSAADCSQESTTATSLSHAPCEDVVSLKWNPQGTLLGTGDGSGTVRLWNDTGALQRTLSRHTGVVFSLKWNRSGDALLSGSMDRTVVVWDAQSGDVRYASDAHTGPVYDVDWRDNAMFASCSGDKTVLLHTIGEQKPKTLRGHKGEVNAVEWDPSGSLLASASDDWTAKLWNASSDSFVSDLRDHQERVYRVRWSPTGPSTSHPNAPLVLATGSFDATVRLWDPETAKCLHTLSRHKQSVSALGFSPDGQLLASASTDQTMNIWSVKDGTIVRTLRTKGAIFDINWSSANRLALCISNKTACIVDVRA